MCFRLLKLIMEDKCPIEPSDYDDFFNALSSTSNGITAMNYFLNENFTHLVNNVTNGRNIATTIFSNLVTKVTTTSEISNVKTYFILYRYSETLVITIDSIKIHSW